MDQKPTMIQEKDYWIFTDQFGSKWKLKPSGFPGFPLLEELIEKGSMLLYPGGSKNVDS